MPKPILVLAAATAIGAASVAVPALNLRVAADPPSDLVLTGACDASGGLLPDGRHLIVADDEDAGATMLRVYDLAAGGAAVGAGINATEAVKAEPAGEEVDLEGLSPFGPSSFVAIGSHSLTKKAKPAPSRRRLVSFTLTGAPPNQTIGSSRRYATLLADAKQALDTLPPSHPLKDFVLDNGKAPNDNGISIEAIAEAQDGGLLIGLRSPLGPGKKAIVLHLTNATAVLDGAAPAAFAPPILLDLGGQGLRDLVRVGPGRYLLIAGDPGDGGAFHLWRWSGPGTLSTLSRVSPIATPGPGISAEALVPTPDRTAAWILFDEGQRPTAGGVECKDLARAADKSFRARRIDLPAR